MITVTSKGFEVSAARRRMTAGVPAVHFSTVSGLTELDPNYIGAGSLSIRESQDTRVPVTFFYQAGTEPESLVLSRASARYEADLPDRLLDLANMPDEVRQGFKEGGRGGGYQAMKDMGYFGFYNTNSALPNAIAVFYPVPVRETEFSRHTEIERAAASPMDEAHIEETLLHGIDLSPDSVQRTDDERPPDGLADGGSPPT